MVVAAAPSPQAKPGLLAAPVAPDPAAEARIAASGIPMPQSKPAIVLAADVTPDLAADPLVPSPAPGETPVPSAKPPALRQTADAGGRT